MADEDILREIARLLERSKSRGEMAGEFLREISVLLLVFAPLDALFNPGVWTWWELTPVVLLALALGYAGMRIEEGRK